MDWQDTWALKYPPEAFQTHWEGEIVISVLDTLADPLVPAGPAGPTGPSLVQELNRMLQQMSAAKKIVFFMGNSVC